MTQEKSGRCEAFLLLGSNKGEREKQLQHAAEEIRKRAGEIEKASSVYETAAWGNTDQPAFLNQVLKVRTDLGPEQLLHTVLDIEQSMGRSRKEKWEERIIDIDLLFYGSEVIQQDNLIVPHPFIQQRRFTLVPLCEIAGEFIHPVFGKSMNELLALCTDMLEVKRWKE